MLLVSTFLFLVTISGLIVYLTEGPVVLDELTEPISLFAILLCGLTLYFAFISPDASGYLMYRWKVRVFTVIPFLALYAAIFPSGVTNRMQLIVSYNGMRRGAIIILIIFLLLAIFIKYYAKA